MPTSLPKKKHLQESNIQRLCSDSPVPPPLPVKKKKRFRAQRKEMERAGLNYYTVDPALKTHRFFFQSVFNAGNRL